MEIRALSHAALPPRDFMPQMGGMIGYAASIDAPLIPAARESAGRPVADTPRALDAAQTAFRENGLKKFS